MRTRLLGDLADLTVGHVGPMASEYVQSGVPFLRSLNVRPFRIDTSDIKFISREFHERLKKSALRPGDVVVVRTGEPGTAAVIPKSLPEANCSDVVIVRPRAGLDPRYLAYLINGASRGFVNSRTVGAVQQHFNVGAAREMPVPDLPLEEQRRIAGVLGALDDLIEVNRGIRTTLDRQGVALVEDLVLRESDRNFVMLEDAASLIETGRRPRGGVRGISEGVPSIGAESIDGLGVFDFSKTKFIPADFAAQMRNGMLESRDVLIYKDGGKPGDFRPHVGMYGDGFPFARMTINEHVYRVRAASPLTEPYLYFWLSTETSMAAMRRLGTGAAIPGLNSTALRSIPVAIPPADIEQRLFPVLEAFVGEALAAASEAQRLAKARDELLPLLLSGQVRVVDVAA